MDNILNLKDNLNLTEIVIQKEQKPFVFQGKWGNSTVISVAVEHDILTKM